MKTKYHTIPILILFIVTLTNYYVSAQEKPTPTVYPYGGEKDLSRKRGKDELAPLNFKKLVDFGVAHFNRIALFDDACFDSSVIFCYAHFDSNAYFNSAQFAGSVYIYNVNFTNIADFSNAHFNNSVDFWNAHFDSSANFNIAHFDSRVDFCYDHFDGNSEFRYTQFANGADFSSAQFASSTDFYSAQFSSKAEFRNALFNSSANFNSSRFLNGFSLKESTFKEEPDFEGILGKGTIDLSKTQFLKGVDLRRSDLDAVDIIYIDNHTFFPDGKLFVRWDQIKDRLRLNISKEDSVNMNASHDSSLNKQRILNTKTDNLKQNCYRKLEIFYHRLRDNYIAQRDNTSADGVMYELGKHRAEILQEFHWKLYGWFFGWGYQPWRFLFFVVLPLIISFAVVWYLFYYELVMNIIDEKIVQKYTFGSDAPKFIIKNTKFFKRKSFKIYDHSKLPEELNRLSRYWHVTFFSASVLLGIRIKKEWIQIIPPQGQLGKSSFLRVLTFEWILGIGLYVTFALLVKGSRFEFIKGLLGF